MLGVDPDAPTDEIRRAYVSLARAHHPDRPADDGGSRGDEERMRDVNAAWAILSDPERRKRYDLEIGRPGPGAPRIQRPDDTFVPFDDGEDDDDSWRYEPDVGDPRTAPGKIVSILPVVLLVLALAVGAASFLLDEGRLLAVAGFFGLLSFVAFVVVPVVAMARAAHYERR